MELTEEEIEELESPEYTGDYEIARCECAGAVLVSKRRGRVLCRWWARLDGRAMPRETAYVTDAQCVVCQLGDGPFLEGAA